MGWRDDKGVDQLLSGHAHLNFPADWGLPYLPSDCNGGFAEATLQITGVMTTVTWCSAGLVFFQRAAGTAAAYLKARQSC